jgi:hypothetical protein
MGLFSPRQPTTYVPPTDGSNRPTVLGGLSDASAEPIRDGQQLAQASTASDLPPPAQGTWRIELRYLPIGHRGHAFLTLVDPEGKTQARTTMWERSSKVDDVAHGTYDEIVREKWARGLQTKNEINERDFDYKGHDPSYELGTDGGQIQNSNSAAYTFGRTMDLDLDGALRDAGMERRFSGWNRFLLDPNYRRYFAPPTFPIADAP